MGPATTRVSNSYGDQNRDCGNFSTTTNIGHVHIGTTTSTPQPVDVKGEILRWISPLKLPDGHRGAKQRRIKGVGDRFVETDRFRGWAHGSSDPTFFCSGDPGSGKTCISALVIDTLRSRADTQNFPLLYLYCNYATYKELYATDLIAELLKKALAELHTIPEEVSREFTELKYHDSGRSPPKDPLGKLCAVLTTFERVYICIDALDEFPSGQRPELLQSLKVLTQQPSKARLFLTGRPLIEHEIKRYLGEGTQTISIKPSEEDIKEYITHMLARDPYPHEMGPKLRNDIMRILPQKASGIFLLVRLKMNAILEAVNPYDRMERLRGMDGNQGLWDEYSKTLVRIHEQGPVKSTIALKALMWLCRSKRPLRVGELCHALAVERGSTVSNCNKASSIWTILGCCLGLATVDKETSTIQEVSTVHLIHSTLKDYLRNNPLLFQGIDLTIAETCLTYLNFEDIKSRPLHLFTASAGDPFLQYASCYWGEHAREDAAGCMEALAKKLLGLHAVTAQDTRVTRIGGLLQSYWSRFVRGAHPPHRHLQDLATPERSGYDKHISAKLLLFEKSWPWGRDPKDLPHGFSGLHCAAFFGLQKLAVAFLDTKDPNLSREDITGSTPLTWAARNGHEGLVQLLLKQDNFDHEVQDNDGCTPFSWAARNGHKEVVELFLQEAAISPETKDSFGRTPLSWASGNGHQGVVGLLLGQ